MNTALQVGLQIAGNIPDRLVLQQHVNQLELSNIYTPFQGAPAAFHAAQAPEEILTRARSAKELTNVDANVLLDGPLNKKLSSKIQKGIVEIVTANMIVELENLSSLNITDASFAFLQDPGTNHWNQCIRGMRVDKGLVRLYPEIYYQLTSLNLEDISTALGTMHLKRA